MKNQIVYAIVFVLTFIGCNEKGNYEKSEKTMYDVVFRENISGSYEKIYIGDHHYKYIYSYTDRGRGPEVEEEISLNDYGMITSQSIKGVNYLKTPLDEYFDQNGRTAQWKNELGEESAEFDGGKLYFRFDGSPAIYEILAQALLDSKTKRVDLFPSGNAELLARNSVTLSNGDTVELLMITGLGMNPTYIWMKDDQMIARISGNLHIVRQDFGELRKELKSHQNEIEDNYLRSLSGKLTQNYDKVLIENVNVFQSDGTLKAGQDVFVEKGIIQAIYSSDNETVIEGVELLNGTGKTLMPGMFDMHTHNNKFRGLMYLAGGITSVRDLANNKQLKELATQFDNNEILGPRIVTYCGIIDGSGPFANQRNVVETLEEGLEEIQSYKDLGYQQIKLYSSIRPEWVKPLIDKAHSLGMRVSGHIPAYMTASQAIDQGYDEIQHVNMLFLNFLPDTIDTRTPLRFTMPATYGKDLDLNSDEYKAFVQQLKSNDILVDLTMGIFENMFTSKRGKISPTYAAISDRMPLMSQRNFYSGGLPKSDEKLVTYKQSYEKMLEVVNDLYQKGVAVVPGTDGLPGFLYHRELELYVKAGIPASEVLQLATIKSAEITGMSESLGSIEVGKLADLILIDGNPVENISDIRRVEWTMKDGYLFDAKSLYQTKGIKHFK